MQRVSINLRSYSDNQNYIFNMFFRISRRSCKISKGVLTPPEKASTHCAENIHLRSWLVWVQLSLILSRLMSLQTSFLQGHLPHCRTVFSSSSMVRRLAG